MSKKEQSKEQQLPSNNIDDSPNKNIERVSQNTIEFLAGELLTSLGFVDYKNDPDMKDTPKRFAKYMRSFAKNRYTGADKNFTFTTFPSKPNMEVTVDELEVRSLCAHHLAPFVGTCTISYTTRELKAGLSKFQRVVDYFASEPQDQEALTDKIACYLVEELQPENITVTMVCSHTCMTVRGVKNSHSKTTTEINLYRADDKGNYRAS
jgi:GTP cyclohydrolase IA